MIPKLMALTKSRYTSTSSAVMSSSSSKPPLIIGVDLDDVLVATNASAAAWHNARYGTNMQLSDFLYYHWWKNPYWGTMRETIDKVLEYYKSDEYINAPAIKDAYRYCKQLKAMGFRLVVVTARSDEHRRITEDALDTYFPGIFDAIEFTASIGGRGASTMTKPQMLRHIGASMLIDDSLDNALDCARAGIPCLLFGEYEWNRRPSTIDSLGFKERERLEGVGSRWWERENVPNSALSPLIRRVDGWEAVANVARQHVQLTDASTPR